MFCVSQMFYRYPVGRKLIRMLLIEREMCFSFFFDKTDEITGWLGLKKKKKKKNAGSCATSWMPIKRRGKKEQMSLIKFRKVCPLGWCLFRRCFGLFTSILLLFQTKLSPRRLGREASVIFRPFPPPLISVLISGCFFSLPVVRGESVAACPHCLLSELNLFLTQNNNPTLFSLPALAFYYFQVLGPISLASRCARGGNCPLFGVALFHIEY